MSDKSTCPKCHEAGYFNFCPKCGTKGVLVENLYKSPYGVWHVTTEGDEEGRSTRDLGTHVGYLDEIAFSLKPFYALQFTKINDKPGEEYNTLTRKVHVNLNIDSETWDMNNKERVQFFKELLSGRPVDVKEGQYYASVILEKK